MNLRLINWHSNLNLNNLQKYSQMSDNIKAIVRLRPLLQFQDQQAWLVHPKNSSIQCLNTKGIKQKLYRNMHCRQRQIDQLIQQYTFKFDSVLPQQITSEQLYKLHARPMIQRAIGQSVNCCIMAYGQTCSGKTFTTLGVNSAPGIIPCALRDVFIISQQNEKENFSFSISYLQIYNERIIDLLTPCKQESKVMKQKRINSLDKKNAISNNKNLLKIVQDSKWGVSIQGLQKYKVNSFEECLNFLELGQSNRSYGSKQNHERSSRSHTVFKIYVQKWNNNYVNFHNTISIVDLAGSQRLTITKNSSSDTACKKIVSEAAAINKSLFQLSNVIQKLSSIKDSRFSNSQQHIPFRDSKLTRILQPSLSGNSLTAIIFCISPALINFNQTLSTLRLGLKAKKIQLQPINNEGESVLVEQLKRKLQAKKRQCKQLNEKVYGLNQQIKVLRSSNRTLKQQNKKLKQKDNQRTLKAVDCSVQFLSSFKKSGKGECQFQKENNNFQSNNTYLNSSITNYLEDTHNYLNQNCILQINQYNYKQHSQPTLQYNNVLYSWGSKKQNRVFEGTKQSLKLPLNKYDAIKELGRVIDIAAGAHHTFVINQEYQLFGWGKNNQNQIKSSPQKSIPLPTKIMLNFKVMRVAAGWSHTLLLTDQGTVYSFGYGKDGQLGLGNYESNKHPQSIDHQFPVSKVYAGHSHSAFIDVNQNCFMFGYNQDCRLMLLTGNLVNKPTRIQIKDVVQAGLGVNHSAVITQNGQLYLGGVGTDGQLGQQLQQSMQGYQQFQTKQRIFQQEKIEKTCPLVKLNLFSLKNPAKKVECGQAMTVVLTKNNELYTFGKPSCSRLGHQNKQPTMILKGIDKVSVGCRYAICWNKKQNKYYGWGFNMHKQVCIDRQSDIQTPELIQQLSNRSINKVQCGYFHAVAIGNSY